MPPATELFTQPREIALYSQAFHELTQSAAYGQAALKLITAALTHLGRT
jgi:hypothetical protein